jgi:tRNA dimethylallyltransferase
VTLARSVARIDAAKRENAPPAPPLVVIGGPTATGKTALSLALARSLAGGSATAEIISADSRQVYRGLDIGTAKAAPADRAAIPHHGLDLVDPDQPFSVADFAQHATVALGGIAARGAVALLVGGTGLYLRAVADGLDLDALPHEPVVRSRIEQSLRAEGLSTQVARLQALAPGLAATTDLRNPRRVARALEIAELRGDVDRPSPRGYPGPILRVQLILDPALGRTWITERARAQFAAGLLDEAESLRRRFDPELPAFSAIGYREAWSVLDGVLSIEEGITLDARRNVAFARRQRTWFRAQPADLVLDAALDPLPAILDAVRGLLAGTRPWDAATDAPAAARAPSASTRTRSSAPDDLS